MNRQSVSWRAFRSSGPVAGLVILGLFGCAADGTPEAEVVRPVRTEVIAGGETVRLRTFPGTVEASRRVELAFRVPGLLETLAVKEGDRVSAGDLIAQLRQGEFEASRDVLKAELDQARAELRALRSGERPEEILRREAEVRAARLRVATALADYERRQRMVAQRVVSQEEFEQAQTAYRIAQEDYMAAQQSLEQATVGRAEDIEAMEARVRALEGRLVESQIRLEDSTLLAPYDGVIAQRFVDQGQNIAPNSRVVQFQDAEEIDIAADVPEAVMAAEIRVADIIRLSANLSAAPGVEFPVRIREIAQVADPVTQTFNVRVAMEAPADWRVLPGMSARVTATYRRASVLGDRLMVPVEAVDERPSGEQVAWVLGLDGLVSPRAIRLGVASGGRVEVADGLQAGDRIVVAGVRFLRDGMRVRDLGDALGAGT